MSGEPDNPEPCLPMWYAVDQRVPRTTGIGHELPLTLDLSNDFARSTAVVRGVRPMSAIGTEETIDRAGGLVGLAG